MLGRNGNDDPDKEDSKLEPEFNTVLPPSPLEDRELIPTLREKGVPFDAEKTSIGMGTQLMFWLIGKARRDHFAPEYYAPVEIFGLYWHFVDIVWIFLFPMLYLIERHV